MTAELVPVVLLYRHRHYRAGMVIDTTEADARRLIRAGVAKRAAEVIENLGNGWYLVPLDPEPRKVHGWAAALEALRYQGEQ